MPGKNKNDKTVLYFLLPAIIVMLFIHIIPILSTIYLSFIDLNLYNLTRFFKSPFVGLKNFIDIFAGNVTTKNLFLLSFRNIFVFGLIVIPVSLALAFGVSLLLNRNIKGKSFYIGLILVPYFTMDSVAYGVWRQIFIASDGFSTGMFNKFLMDMGAIREPVLWFAGNYAMIPVIAATVWKTWPFLAIVILAALRTIPNEYYEIGQIEGANSWQVFSRVTFPLMWPVLRVLLIITVTWIINSYNNFMIMLGMNNTELTTTPSLAIAGQTLFGANYSISACMALILLLFVLIVSLFLLIRKKEYYA